MVRIIISVMFRLRIMVRVMARIELTTKVRVIRVFTLAAIKQNSIAGIRRGTNGRNVGDQVLTTTR